MLVPLLGKILLIAAMPAACSDDAEGKVMLTEKTCFVLATVKQGREALVREDAFVRNLSRFDLECRLQTTDRATREAWKKLVADQVRDWEPKDREPIQAAIGQLKARLEPFDLPLPEEILLICTTGKDEGGAAYCRGASIVLPSRMVAQEESKLVRLLAHELFHVLSNQNAKLREKLYEIIGFHVMPPIELPASLRERRITNPDAPSIDCWIELEQDDRKVRAAPILFASPERYDPASKKSFFEYLTFRMLVLQEDNSPALKDGEPVLLDPRGSASYFAKIGRNTNYIIHPDEILADNFAHLLLGTPNLATPRVVEELGKRLKQ